MGGGAPLGTPRQYPNPTVTAETQNVAPPNYMQAPAPAATFTYPPQPQTYGQPLPYGQPFAVGGPIPVGEPIILNGPIPVGPPQMIGGPVNGVPPVPSVLPLAPRLFGNRPLLRGIAPQLDAPLYAGAVGPSALLAGPSRWDFNADFLLWFIRSPYVPALITTSSPQFNGILGQGDTRTILGNEPLTTTVHTGGRFGTTYWLTEDHRWGVEGSLFFLGRNGKNFETNTNQNALLARPFFNLNQGVPFSELVAAPGLATGSVAVVNETQMWGADVNLRRAFLCGPCSKLDLFGGFRFLSLTDGLSITESFARTPDSPTSIGAPNALFGTVTDQFRTTNHFYGAQLGAVGEIRRGRWYLEGRASVALGTVFQFAEINGAQIIQTTAGQTVNSGGLLAVPGANIGTFSQHVFGVVPEAGFKVGYNLTQNLRLAVGYNLLYLNSAIRPGDQIDSNLDVTKIPNFPLAGNVPALNTLHPTLPMRTTGVFAQGINFTLQYRW